MTWWHDDMKQWPMRREWWIYRKFSEKNEIFTRADECKMNEMHGFSFCLLMANKKNGWVWWELFYVKKLNWKNSRGERREKKLGRRRQRIAPSHQLRLHTKKTTEIKCIELTHNTGIFLVLQTKIKMCIVWSTNRILTCGTWQLARYEMKFHSGELNAKLILTYQVNFW